MSINQFTQPMKKFWKRLFMSYDDMMEDILTENKEKIGEENYKKQMDFVKSGKFSSIIAGIILFSLATAPLLRRVIFNPPAPQPTQMQQLR